MIEAGGDFFQDLAGPMSLRAQVADHDSALCAHYPESLREGVEILAGYTA